MRNRFKLNESEKNRIKDLHGIGIIKEQWEEVMLDEVQDEVEEGATPDYSEEEGVTLTIDPKGFDYEGDMSRKDIISNLWQVQGLLQDCSPAIALTRVVEMLSRLGEDVNMLDRDFKGDCNCEGGGIASGEVDSIDV